MEIKQYTRKPFPVNAVQVSLQNVDEVAEWAGGTVSLRPTKMMGTYTDLPVIILKGQGENRGKEFEAPLGCWIVELNGSFRSYKPQQFDATFDEYIESEPRADATPTEDEPESYLVPNAEALELGELDDPNAYQKVI